MNEHLIIESDDGGDNPDREPDVQAVTAEKEDADSQYEANKKREEYGTGPESHTPSRGAAAEQTAHFLTALFGDKPTGSFINIWTRQDKAGYWAGTVEDAVRLSRRLSSEGKDVYFGLGLSPVAKEGPHARVKADEVIAITALWADIDIAGPGHQSGKKYPPDKAAVKAILDASGFDPTVIVNSGHGIHVYLCLEEPWVFTDESDRGEALTLVQAYQQRLKDSAGQMGYDIDSTFDLARVLRVPGTINFKVPEKPVPVTLLGLSPRLRYSVAELKSLLMNTDEPLSADSTRVRLQLADGGQEGKTPSIAGDDAKADILPKLMKLMDDEEFRETWFDRRDGFKSRSEQDFALAVVALRHGWRDEEVSELLFSHRRSYAEQEGRVDPKLSRPDYFKRTVAAARDHLDRRTEQRDIEELREEAEAIVQSVRGGDLYPSEEERQVLMEYLSSVFRVQIKEMVKYESEVPTYVFTFESGKEMEITKVRQLMSQSEFGTRLLAAVGDAPERMSNQTWHTICLIMIKAFRVERDWTGGKLRRFEELIRDYIDSADVSDDLREALDYRYLFRGPDGTLYLYKQSFLKWAMDRRGQRVSDSDAEAAMKRLGFLSEEKHQRKVKRNLWRLPPEFTPSGDAPDG